MLNIEFTETLSEWLKEYHDTNGGNPNINDDDDDKEEQELHDIIYNQNNDKTQDKNKIVRKAPAFSRTLRSSTFTYPASGSVRRSKKLHNLVETRENNQHISEKISIYDTVLKTRYASEDTIDLFTKELKSDFTKDDFIKELNLCCIIFDFTEGNLDKSYQIAKDNKRECLERFAHIYSQKTYWLTDDCIPAILQMISANLFRSLQCPVYIPTHLDEPEEFDSPAEDEHHYEPSWYHIFICQLYVNANNSMHLGHIWNSCMNLPRHL